MAASLLQPDVGLIGPALTAGLPTVAALRRMQGPVPDNCAAQSLSSLGGKVWCGQSQASNVDEEIPPEGPQDIFWQKFFSDPTPWWDSRPSKTNSRHPVWPNNRHKPAWLGSWLGGSPDFASTSVEWQRAFATHEDPLEVELCSKVCEVGRITDAVDALNILVQRGCDVHDKLFYRVLKRCIADKNLVLGRRIHALAIKSGYEGNAFLATHLIGLYASHGKLEEAMRVFSKVSTPSSYNWATIIFANAGGGEAAQGIRLYRQMLESTIKPDNRIYVAVLKACATAGDLVAGKEVHAHILASPGKPDIFVQTGLLAMYSKCGSLEDARRVFDRLPSKDVVTWTAMIAGYGQQGMGLEALNLYTGMQLEGLSPPNRVTFVCLLQACTSVGVGALHQGQQLHAQIKERGLQGDVVLGCSLVNMYAKCGSLEDARNLFDRLPERDVVTWTAMIAGYAQQGFGQEALSLYSRMQQEGLAPPDSCTFVCLLQACATISSLSLGKQLHAQIEKRGMLADVVVGSSLVNMYAKCGSMLDSQRMFDLIGERSIDAWNALVGGYTRQGNSEAVFDLLNRMRLEGLRPNAVTFLTVLTVCSHVGLVEEGRKYFDVMRTDYGISPSVDHYTCMIDLLGRAGHLEEALQMAKTMPFPPNRSVWHTLLGACRKWNNIEIGQQVFEFAVTSDREDAASYVLMSNIYARAQMWEEAKEMQGRRTNCGAWKQPGQCWWTDMGGAVHTFVVGDMEHPESEGSSVWKAGTAGLQNEESLISTAASLTVAGYAA